MQTLTKFLHIIIKLYHPLVTLESLSSYIRYHKEKALPKKTVEYSAFRQGAKSAVPLPSLP